jgi:3'-phosphoadenosine 5'-phosphosulfate sulfotransferase (PAPS reductase)/FAD synthetase
MKDEEVIVIVNFSGGKDSTAMLLRMIELGEKIDYIVFADTMFEFPALYKYIKMIEKLVGREIIILKPSKTFDDWRFGKLTRGKNKGEIRGFPQVISPCYWMRESKYKTIQEFSNQFENKINVLGIASDEVDRVQKEKSLRYPLIEWGWTEEDCIEYLQQKGFVNELYTHFSRLGCWMCPKQSDYSKYMLWKHYPELWDLFKEMERENIRDTGRTIWIKPSQYYENKFNDGFIAKDNGKICFECKGIRKSFTGEIDIESDLVDYMIETGN